jgi:hypothetical protein
MFWLHQTPRDEHGFQLETVSTPSPAPTVAERPPLSEDELRVRFENLVLSHPDPDVRDGLMTANQGHNLKFVLVNDRRSIMSLGIEERVAPTHEGDELARRLYVGVLYVSLSALRKADTPDNQLALMAIMGHEYQHYRQWVAAPPEHWQDFLTYKIGTRKSPAECERQFLTELAGYTYECRMLMDAGLVELGIKDLCPLVGDKQAFALALVERLSQSAQGQGNPECLPHWASVAGWIYK